MKLWIKPVHHKETGRLMSLALCRTDNPLVDEHILEHFPAHTSGNDIEETAKEFFNASEVEWGTSMRG
jgi:hypothetical protein